MELFLQVNHTLSYVTFIAFALILLERRFSLRASLFIGLGTVLLFQATEYFSTAWKGDFAGLCVSFIKILLAQGTVLLLGKRRSWGLVFSGLSAALYDQPGGMVGTLVFGWSRSLWLAAAASAMTHGLLLWAAYSMGRKTFLYFQREAVFDQPWVCLMPALAYVCIYSLIAYPFNLAAMPKAATPALCIVVIMTLCYALIFLNAARQQEREAMARDNDLLTACVQGLSRNLETSRQAALFRHDSRHGMRLLHGLLENGQVREAMAALEEMDKALLAASPKVYCKRPAVNAIMGEMDASAQAAGVSLEAQLAVPEHLPISDVELASVVANLVENAIQAVSALPPQDPRPRRVDITARQSKNGFLLETTNPCLGPVALDPETGLPRSEKGQGHGLGLRSVAALARRGGGLLDAGVEGGFFYVRLYLPLT